MHQSVGRVVDEHQQGALRSALLEPPMLAAIDLHRVADAVAPRARLIGPLLRLIAIKPQRVDDHPLPQSLAGQRKAVLSGELLGGQHRTEICIAKAEADYRPITPSICGT